MDLWRQGLRFNVRVEGPERGPVVLFLHGFPQDTAAWDRVWPPLARTGFRVFIPEQRGCSAQARPPGRRAYRMSELIDDVLALADQIGADQFHLVGHDLGGAVAWRIGAWHPRRVLSLTVISTPHPNALCRAVLTHVWQARQSAYLAFFQLPWLPERLLLADGCRRFRERLISSGLDESHALAYTERLGDLAAMRGALGRYRGMPLSRSRPSRGRRDQEHGQAIGRPGSLRSGRIPVPTLYVWGSEDAFLCRRAALDSGRWVSGRCQVVELPGSSHWIPEQDPELLVELISRHLADSPAS